MTTTAPDTSANRITLRNVRLSYPNLFEPKGSVINGQTIPPKYSAAILLDKVKDADQIKAVQAIVERMFTEKWGKKDKRSSKLTNPLRDGSEKNDKNGYGPGVFFINAKADPDHKPEVVDAVKGSDGKLARLKKEDGRPYAGSYVNVSLNFFAFDMPVNKGISAGLGNVQFVGHGERFGGGADADSEFDEIEQDTVNSLLD
jgi:hypothetical protein